MSIQGCRNDTQTPPAFLLVLHSTYASHCRAMCAPQPVLLSTGRAAAGPKAPEVVA